jgi:hypothetical protein
MSSQITANSPTVTELLDASVENYTQGGTAGDLQPFLVNGHQLQLNDYADGAVAAVWLTPEKQVVIAYEGTFGNTPNGFSLSFLLNEVTSDIAGFYGTKPIPAESSGLAFATQVEAAAASQGISAANIFVTGHSLGAAIASYVAENTGFGGIAFEAPGIAPAVGTKGNGSNFVSVDTYGDVIPAYSSTETVLGAIAPANQPLYGQVLHIGAPAWQTSVSVEAAGLQLEAILGGKSGQVAAAVTLFGLNLIDHAPLTQAYALGVTLPAATTAAGVAMDTLGNTSGPVLNVANDTVTQLLAYISATDGNTEALTPPAASSSTTSVGGVGGQLQRFVDAMATLAPHGALASSVGTGVQAGNMALGLAVSGGPLTHGSHPMA